MTASTTGKQSAGAGSSGVSSDSGAGGQGREHPLASRVGAARAAQWARMGAHRADGAHEIPQPRGDGWTGTACGVQILGTGSSAPQPVVPNEALSELGFDSDWIIQRTGIRQRHRAPEGMSTSEMDYPAVRACLEAGGVGPDELDMLIVATMTPDCPTPATACNLQLMLGATCPAFDVNAACSGFLYALALGAQFVLSGNDPKIVVVGVDMMSRTVNPQDHKTFALFGDGAGAVLLGRGADSQGLFSYLLGAQADGGRFLCQPGGGTIEPITPERFREGRQFVEMDGRAVFRWAVRTVELAARQAMESAGTTADEIDLVIMHQANIRIIDAAATALGFPKERLFNNVAQYGNTSAGSVPLALDEAVRAGRISRGDRVLLVGFGAGLSWGAAVLGW